MCRSGQALCICCTPPRKHTSITMFKLAVFALCVAAASAGLIGAPVAAPLAYAAGPAVAYSSPIVHAAPAVAYSAPVVHAAPVVKAIAPVATSYQNTYKISRSAVAVAPVATYAAAPAVHAYAAAPAVHAAPLAYAAAPAVHAAPLAYAAAPAVHAAPLAYAAAPAYAAPLGYAAAPALYH